MDLISPTGTRVVFETLSSIAATVENRSFVEVADRFYGMIRGQSSTGSGSIRERPCYGPLAVSKYASRSRFDQLLVMEIGGSPSSPLAERLALQE